MNRRPEFKLVCVNCDSLGITLDFAEDAPVIDPDQVRLLQCSARHARGASRPRRFEQARPV